MLLVISILGGILCGIIGVIPLVVSAKLTRKLAATRVSGVAIGLVAIGLSFIPMLAAVYACHRFYPDIFVGFALSTTGTFLVGMIVYCILKMQGKLL